MLISPELKTQGFYATFYKSTQDIQVSGIEFDKFVRTNKDIVLSSGENPVFETNDDMINSYLMIGPTGSVIKNSNMEYSVRDLKISSFEGINDIVNWEKYNRRGGDHWRD